MNSKHSLPWLSLERIEAMVQLEPTLIVLGLGLFGWVFYKIVLRGVSPDRHRFLQKDFKNLLLHCATMVFLLFLYVVLARGAETEIEILRVLPYVGLAFLLWVALCFTKTCRLLMFEYLFWGHMREGVPALLVNLFSLVLSIFIYGWLFSDLFNIHLTPLLATSAAVSVVFGLAMQDTLGNLFAGMALQIDKPFGIGDWIQVEIGTEKTIGQVLEVTWRATTLIGWGDEHIIIPNRTLAQSLLANFSTQRKPIIRSHLIKIKYGSNIEKARKAILEGLEKAEGVMRYPEPGALINELNESWVQFRIFFYVSDYGKSPTISDRALQSILSNLESKQIEVAQKRIELTQNP